VTLRKARVVRLQLLHRVEFLIIVFVVVLREFLSSSELISRCSFRLDYLWITLAIGFAIVIAVLVATAVQPPSLYSSLLLNIAACTAIVGAFLFLWGSICLGAG